MSRTGIKEIRIVIDEDTYNLLINKKGNRSWKDFLVEAAEKDTGISTQFLINKVNELMGILRENFVDSDRYGLIDLIRAMLVNLIREDYDTALSAAKVLTRELERITGNKEVRVVKPSKMRKEVKAEEKKQEETETTIKKEDKEEREYSIDDILNAKPAVDTQ